MLNNDNEESRKMVEQCYKQSKTVVNPIIDWTTDEVWEFIKEFNIPYCKLYDEGYTRLGCIGCPMGSNESRLKDFERYPKYKQAYIRAFERMIENYDSGGGTLGNKALMYSSGMPKENMRWKTTKELMEWWIR